jgi:hypothetical protein
MRGINLQKWDTPQQVIPTEQLRDIDFVCFA